MIAGEIEALRVRLAAIDTEQRNGDSEATRALLDESLEALATSVEELRTTSEELHDQNTALEEARTLLEEERQRYETLFELAPDAYIETDDAGVIHEANLAAAALFGRDGRFLIGKPLAALLRLDSRRALRDQLSALKRDGGRARFELVLWTQDERNVAVMAHVGADDGDPGRLRWLLRDVTADRQRELELRVLTEELESRVAERTQLLAAVMHHLPVGVALVDARTDAVVTHNPRAAELLGPTWDRVSPPRRYAAEARRADGQLLTDDDWPSVRALRGEVVLGELLRLRTVDGAENLFEISAAPVEGSDGSIAFAVLVFQDVAERERRDHSVRTFVTNAAHELGTPLAGIKAAVEALQAGAKDDAAHRDRFLEHIAREAMRLERLMRALLVLARAQARAEPANLAVVPLEPLLAEVALGVTPADGVEVEVDCAAEVAAVANRSLLEQALVNLAGNAARYTERGAIRLSAEQRDEFVEVVVTDTGPGIPDEVRARLFERFVRGHGPEGGFGLGLAITRESVEATGGTVDIEAPDEGGTRAVIRLPAARLLEKV